MQTLYNPEGTLANRVCARPLSRGFPRAANRLQDVSTCCGDDMEEAGRKQLLVVDDDVALRDLLVRYLTEHGFACTGAGDGRAMDAALAQREFDLVVLDLMLPDEDGLRLAQRLRSRNGPPVIMISACGEETDRIVGLEIGADDYVAKPFNPRELLARIRAVLRRAGGTTAEGAGSSVAFGPFVLDLEGHRLLRNGAEAPLTGGEFNLLKVFLEHRGRVLSRDMLLQLLKGYEHQPFDRSIDVRVTRLRRKIEDDPAQPCWIRTIWGEGYLFSPHD
jgi:two-component system phosphate regulon response regulator OmpR